MSYKRYWVALAIVIIGSFAVLGGVGRKMISEAPPIPDVYNTDGQLLFTGSSITDGQGVWQSIGGQEIGTVWGHGAYVAPDWSADWLHRESEILLNTWAVRAGAANFEALGPDQQAIFKARLIREMRTNTYDASRNRVTLSADRAAAFEQLRAYYTDVFATGRSEYAIPSGALTNAAKQHQLAAFFWWTSWACSTDRPGSETTYTNNWPHEPLIGNVPTSGAVLWSVLSFVGLLAGIGGLVWWYASQEKELVHGPYPESDPFLVFKPTPSQRATLKYFFVVVILWGVQILMGSLDRALRSRRTGLLRIPARQVSALCRHAHLASANRHFLDRNVVAGNRSLRGSGGQRPRTEVSASRCQRTLRCTDSRGRRFARRRVDGHSAAAWQHVVLVRAARVMNMSILAASGRFCCSSDWFFGSS